MQFFSRLFLALLLLSGTAPAEVLESVHFLIPGGEGGGWDTTARETGKALLAEDLIDRASYDNYVGAGGGRALIDLVESPKQYGNTLMVQSTPIIFRNLNGMVEYGYRDVKPVCTLIAEYQAVAVRSDSNLDFCVQPV
ncbi:hypothetical protein C8D92_110146 [Tamilnaduibacter salinus]|uniref:Tripartite tricarboxylate transporter substrate binding protein n=1 Tax=Tamilnaduibacter salinus TaxID=1484056 RepID=A0A2U1CU14_9GAMM|nr:hypothetical protein [Tamilnaduibacter salinus]PVY70115.1 hypothetical protein C8D92_110146 [Tamilnaduibacter salinus]